MIPRKEDVKMGTAFSNVVAISIVKFAGVYLQF
jgi:hypothetical protein